jgi:hypothetical protein
MDGTRLSTPAVFSSYYLLNHREEMIDIQMSLWYSRYHNNNGGGLEWTRRQRDIWKEHYWA